MKKEEHLRKHLELCKAVYERMKREGAWPWHNEDSPNSVELVESENQPSDV